MTSTETKQLIQKVWIKILEDLIGRYSMVGEIK
jgi:hypothetical protein